MKFVTPGSESGANQITIIVIQRKRESVEMLRFKQDCQDWQSTDAVSVTKKSRLDPGVLSLVDGLLGCVCSLAGSLGGIGGGGGCWKGKKLCGAKKQPDPQVRLGLSKYAQQAQTIFKVEQ